MTFRVTIPAVGAVAFVCALLSAPHRARAELGGADCLELMVAQATTVVYAKVGDGRALEVLKTIKGRAEQRFFLDPSDDALRDTVTSEHVLVFLDADGKLTRSSSRIGLLRFMGAQPATAYTLDWSPLHDEEQIVHAAIDAAKWSLPTKTVSIEAPFGGATFRGWDAYYVRFPVDQRLERAARGWARRGYAEAAVQALREFPSPENAVIVRTFLDCRDIATSYSGGRLSRSTYPVSDLAWHTLESWGEHDPRPIMVVPDDYYRPLRWYVSSIALVLLVLPAALVCVIARTRRVPHTFATFLATIGIAALVLCFRGYRTVDEVFLDRADRQFWISSAAGWLQVTSIPNWRGRLVRDRYVPMGEEMDGLTTNGNIDSMYPHLQPPRGWLYGAIPFQPMQQLWTVAPSRVTRDEDGHIARLLTGFDVTTYGSDKPPLAVQRFQVRWVVLIAAFGTWPAGWILTAVYQDLRTRRRRSRGRCVGCGYDLRGSPGDRCPECGLAATPASCL